MRAMGDENEELNRNEGNEDENFKEARKDEERLRIICKYCIIPKPSMKLLSYPKHLKEVHQKDPETVKEYCHYCHEKVFSKRAHHSRCLATILECDICYRKFHTEHTLHRHVRDIHKDKCECPVCGVQTSKSYMKVHMLKHDKDWMTKCNRCKRKVTTRNLSQHDVKCREKYKKIAPQADGSHPRYVNCRVCSYS